MVKTVLVGATALFVAASPPAYAQTPSAAAPERISLADWNKLTDLRIDLVKAALQLTPDQQKAMAGCRKRYSLQRQGSAGAPCEGRRNGGQAGRRKFA